MEATIGIRVRNSEECRRRIGEAIGADETNDRAKKVKERFEHYAAQQVEEGDVRGKSPRQEDEPKEEVAPEPAAEEAMDTGAEKVPSLGPQGR